MVLWQYFKSAIDIGKMALFSRKTEEKTTTNEVSKNENTREKITGTEVSYQHTPEFMRSVCTPASMEATRLRNQQRNLEIEIQNAKHMLEIENMKNELKILREGMGREDNKENLGNWETMLMKILEPVLLQKFAQKVQEPPKEQTEQPKEQPQQQPQEQELVSRFTDDQIRAFLPSMLTAEQREKLKQLTEDEVIHIHQIICGK